MTKAEQEHRRQLKLRRERNERYNNARKAKAEAAKAEADKTAPFSIGETVPTPPPTPTTPLVRRCKACGSPAYSDYQGQWFCYRHVPGYRAPSKPLEVKELPDVPRQDPMLFDTASDPNRPSWFPPTVIRLTVSPQAVYAYGQELAAEQAAQQRAEAAKAAEADRQAQDRTAHAYWRWVEGSQDDRQGS